MSRILQKTLVGAAGLEPATLCLEGRCSIRLSYAPVPGVFSSILAGLGRYFPGTGSQPRVTKSLRLSTSRIPSHSIPPPTTTLVRMVLWRRCMKNSATSIIFTTAINSAMTTLNGPRSMVATTVVAAVRISSDRKTNVEVLIESTCSCMLVLVTGYEIQQWEQKDPDDIDKVPVEAAYIHRRVI